MQVECTTVELLVDLGKSFTSPNSVDLLGNHAHCPLPPGHLLWEGSCRYHLCVLTHNCLILPKESFLHVSLNSFFEKKLFISYGSIAD